MIALTRDTAKWETHLHWLPLYITWQDVSTLGNLISYMFSGQSDTDPNWYRRAHYHAIKFFSPYKQGGTIQTAYWEWVRLIPKWCLGMVQEADTCLRPNPFKGPFWQFKNIDNHKITEILFEGDLIQLPAWSWTIATSSSGLPCLHPPTSWKDPGLEIWQPLWATSLCFWWGHFSYSPTWTSESQSMVMTPRCTLWNHQEELIDNWTQFHLLICLS